VARARGSRLLNEELRGEQVLVIGDTRHDIRCARAIQANPTFATHHEKPKFYASRTPKTPDI